MSPIAELFETLSERPAAGRRLDTGETLFRTGDPVRFLYVVVQGRLRLLRRGATGSEITLHRAGSGESLAEASLFAERYHCDAVAETRSELRAYPKPAIVSDLTAHPERMRILLQHFAGQIQALRARVEILNLRNAADRVLVYLQLHWPDGSDQLVIDQSWKQLASELGITHEAMYRALARLERTGVLYRDGATVRLAMDSPS